MVGSLVGDPESALTTGGVCASHTIGGDGADAVLGFPEPSSAVTAFAFTLTCTSPSPVSFAVGSPWTGTMKCWWSSGWGVRTCGVSPAGAVTVTPAAVRFVTGLLKVTKNCRGCVVAGFACPAAILTVAAGGVMSFIVVVVAVL
jgi:hypothetical protein